MIDVTWLAGHAKTSFTHHESPLLLTSKSGSKQLLVDLVKEITPPCRLNPLLFNGHLQTMWTSVKDAGPPIHYKRKVFQSSHEVYAGEYVVDFVVPEESPNDDSLPERTTYFTEEEETAIGSPDAKPMLVCLHGLTGGSHEVYLRQVVAPVTASGWEACVITARGCAMSKITTPQLFNARATWDVRQTVKWLRETFPNRPLYGVGFSLGANILTTYLGEEGAACELKAAVACSNPWNLELSHHALMRTYLGREIYSRTMGGNMMKLFRLHREQILKNPKIDESKVKTCKYLYEFDRAIQAPTWGYPTEGAYYRDAQSVDAINSIRIPFLAINAEDDPISNFEAIPWEEFKQNPYAVLCTTNWGGHLSWFQFGGKRWFATAIATFFKKLENDIELEAPAGKAEKSNGTVAPIQKFPIFDPSHRRLIVPL